MTRKSGARQGGSRRQPEELPPDLYERLKEHCDLGNAKCELEQYREAIEDYQNALLLIPEPIEEWEASTWVLVALGDCYFLLGDFPAAHGYLSHAMVCPGALGTPFIHLRLGEVQLELGNEARAKDELARAYMGGGPEIFESEEPKYLAYLRRFMDGI
jgi:tetratricopeptide (TPR) repeat protein